MKQFDVLWIEDEEDYQDGILYSLKAKRDALGFAVIPWWYDCWDKLLEFGHMELSGLHMSIVLVDYNLDGSMEGDKIIAHIRSHKANNNIPIIFYSGAKNIEELEKLTSKYENIYYSQKGTLQDDLEAHLADL
jgi:CheY-like chemotaxis protein